MTSPGMSTPSADPPGYTRATMSRSSGPRVKTRPVAAMPPSQSSTAYRRISSPESSGPGGASGTARPGRRSGGVPNEYRISPRLVCEITTFGLVRVTARVSTLVPVDTARVETRTSRRDCRERRIAGARGIATPRAVIGDMAGGAGLGVLLKSFGGCATAVRTAGDASA